MEKKSKLTKRGPPTPSKLPDIKSYESKVMAIQLELSFESKINTKSIMKQASNLLLPRHWSEIAFERNLNGLCGYPPCHLKTTDEAFKRILTEQSTLDQLSTLPSSVDCVTQFCSHVCRLQTKILYTAAPTEPVYLRAQTQYPHGLCIQESQRSSDPIQPYKSNSIEGYLPLPSLFSLLVSVFQKLVTQSTKAYVTGKNSAFSIRRKSSDFQTNDEVSKKIETERRVGMPNYLSMDIFFERLSVITRHISSFFPTVESDILFLHVESIAKTFRHVDKAVHLLISQNIYSWIFVLVCLWGASQSSPELNSSLFDSLFFQSLFDQVLIPVSKNTGISLSQDAVEQIGKCVFY